MGFELSLNGEPDFDKKKKNNRFQRICGTVRKYLKKTRIDTQMKFYKVATRPTLLHGGEKWVITKRDLTCLEAAEMRFSKKCQRIHKIRQNKKRSHKEENWRSLEYKM